ncbi:MAG: hypothetical protein EPN21_03785 [Methylococcaceae bacterium]|nr:MAG: hypothetical protein EPN21_03785 [Methylococcaceae bacterium]
MSILLRWFFVPLLLMPLLSPAGQDDDDDAAAPAMPPTRQAGEQPAAGVVALTPQQQRAAGLVVQVLTESRRQPEFSAYAKVLDVQPLLALSTRQRALQADLAVYRGALSASQLAETRTAKLLQDNAASARSLQLAKAQRIADASRSAAAEQQLLSLRHEALQQWGPVLAEWLLGKPGNALERLWLRQDVLVELALPPNRALPPGIETVRLAPREERRQAVAARLVSAAPFTGDITQGETWFAIAPAEGLRTGMRLNAWIAGQRETSIGVELPVTAVLWRAGQPWVYLQTGEQQFVRRLIAAYHDNGDSWFVDTGLKPGDKLVVNGAQLLLSEEFRRQIPDEGDD